MQFLDLAGVKKFKKYVDDKFTTIEDHESAEEVTAAALNDLNDRVIDIEDGDWVTAEDYSEIEEAHLDTYTKQEIDAMLAEIESGDSNAYVTALGTSGNNLTWTKNGTTNNITVPYSTNAGTASKLGNSTIGASNRPIYLNAGTPTVTNPGEAFLSWGGQNFSGSYGPIDAAMVSELGACRTMFAKAAGIVVEYSTNSGTTWTDYGATDAQKVALFSSGYAFVIGKNTTSGAGTSEKMLRVTLRTSAANIYTNLNKFVIFLSTEGSTGCYCTIRCRTQQNYEDNIDTWVTRAEQVPVSGYSGYNVINISATTTYGNTKTTQYGEWQFIFGCTGFNTASTAKGLNIQKIFGFGGVGWVTPSNMAKTGHLYSFDSSQNATFPAKVTAGSLAKSGGTSSQFLKADGSVDSNTYSTTDTKNTAGSTDTSNKIFLIGATSQAANPQTYSNENVYEQNGELTASKFNGPLETSYTDTTNNTSMYKSIGLNKKVYTGVLGVANGSSPNNNTYANQSVYFLTIHPTSWDAQWSIKYRLNIHLDNESQLYKSSSTASTVSVGVYEKGIYDCNWCGTGGAYNTFHMFQSQKNTSYRPIYYHMLHNTTSAGFNAGYGHKIGVSFASSYLPTPVTDYSSGSAIANTKYSRTIEVIVEEAVNCTFELANTLEVEGDAYRDDYTKLNTTYYTTNTSSSNSAGRWINISATTQGLYESGDDNTYTYTQQSANYMKNTTKSGDTGVKLWSYPLVGFDKDGNAMGISVYSGSQSSNTTSISAKGTRLYCTEGFDYTKGIRYVSTSSSFDYNADMNVSTQINYSGVDFRYTDNCVPSATANNLGLVNRKPVYLRGTIGSDGLFYLAPIDVTYNNGTYQRAWVQDIPSVENEDGEYVYWFIGHPYYNSSYAAALFQLNLITQGELVWYKDGNVRPYIITQLITETDPVFSASVASSITASDISNWNSKTSNTGTVTQVKVGTTAYNPASGVVSLPAYPTTLPASDVSAWAKASTKPTYTASEVGALPSTTTIPAAPGTLTTTSTTALSTGTNEALSGNISLHKVAKTGTYSDLIGTPTIPAVNNATLTIQKNGTTVNTFTANASSNVTANIQVNEVPSYSTSNNGQVLSVVNGSLAWITPAQIYSGSGTPSNSTGNNGDIYVQS